ncbi:LptA/OstA family protein [Elioraea sp.]|uniref:LptA/OstA family protein n=1 Tax=Elioraea sp. TaxID=2185103 RepID=UPI003F70E09B
MRAALALAAALTLGVPAAAQELALTGEGPVEILADDAIEWRRDDQTVIARGNARASRGGTTVFADRLIARYRNREGAPPAGASPTGSGEIWRLEAEGRVRIVGGNDRAEADRAVYDLDRRVLVLTGRALSLTNGADRVTARDALEYWAETRMAVARGEAVVTSEDRRLEADTVVAYFVEASAEADPPPQATPGAQGPRGANRLDRAEAFGDVRITTANEIVRGERGVYTPGDGLARVTGNVRITRGQNQLNGHYGEVNMKTGVSRLMPSPGGRVAGMIVPEERRPPAPAALPPPPAPVPRR